MRLILIAMAKQGDTPDLSQSPKDREVLKEIARLITERGTEAGPAGLVSSGGSATTLGEDTVLRDEERDSEGGLERVSLEFAARLLEAFPAGVALCANDRILSANEAFALAFGYRSGAEIIDAGGLGALFPERDLNAQSLDRPKGKECLILTAATRSGRHIDMPVARENFDFGRESYWLLVLHRKANDQPEIADAPRPGLVLGVSPSNLEFLAKISHEIRTPLNSIIGFAEFMKEERLGPIGNVKYRGYIDDIHQSGQHALSLINDLLDLSKIESGNFEPNFTAVDANEVIAESVKLMQPQAQRDRVVVRLSLAPELGPILADRRSLKQVALNLLSNAVKFTESGGQVIASTSRESDGGVRISVRDTGVGMTAAGIKQAMMPFRQLDTAPRKQDGTGLGLPLTKALVEANRAAMHLKSRPGSGTRVDVIFPADRVAGQLDPDA